VKIWDATNGKNITTFKFGNEVEDQQVGCLWQGDFLVSVSLAGDIYYLDINNPDKPRQILRGHQKFITALAVEPSTDSFYTAGYDAVITKWIATTGENHKFNGKGHTNQVVRAQLEHNQLFTVAWDDSVRTTSLSNITYSAEKTATDGQPSDISVRGDVAIVSTINGVTLLKGGKPVGSIKAPNSTSAALNPNASHAAVGNKDGIITIYAVEGSSLKELFKNNGHRGAITRVVYSDDGAHLASADTNREILIWAANEQKGPVVNGWVHHNARVNDIAWSPDNVHLASGSLDQSIIVWSIQDRDNRVIFKQAHQGGVNAVRWWNPNTLVSVGQDCTAKTWNVKHK